MYERFTSRARKIAQLANSEAQRFKHEYIGTEHLLLGLIREGSGLGVQALKELNVNLDKIVSQIESLTLVGHLPITAKLPQTPRAKKVIEAAMEEARNLKHKYVGTEHILLGLLRVDDAVAAQVLMNCGLRLEDARAKIVSLLAENREEFRADRSFAPDHVHPATAAKQLEPPPARCPKCGGNQVVRVLWRSIDLYGPDNKKDIETGKAILAYASQLDTPGPSWVCLQCQSGWLEVHELAIQDFQLQLDKEKAVANIQFETAARLRDAQVEVRKRLLSMIEDLQRE